MAAAMSAEATMTPTVFRIALVLFEERAAGLGGFQILREIPAAGVSSGSRFRAGNYPNAVRRQPPHRPENLAYWWVLGRVKSDVSSLVPGFCARRSLPPAWG